MSRIAGGPAADEGVATVWAATGIAVIMAALLLGLHIGAAIVARHRAEAAADLAALAAAGHAVHGTAAACRRAGEVATAMGGEVTQCGLDGWDALVEVRVAVPLALPGATDATGRARAGPVAETTAAPEASAIHRLRRDIDQGAHTVHRPSVGSTAPSARESGGPATDHRTQARRTG
jgi:secretion/DNA translocation related TadE-like protein